MSGNKYLADTNVFIYLFDKHPALKPLLESEWLYSFITEIELLAKPNISSSEIKNIKMVLSVCNKVSHIDLISEITISLKRQYNIKLPDAIIAATAIFKNVPLLTYDKGFTKIKELDVVLLEP
jgi:predicted nucleic acid-binding protein